MTDLTEGYVCAACDAKPDHKCYLRDGRWLCGPCYDMERIEEFEKDIASLRATIERLTRERDEERELHRMRLTAIEVCAGCNTPRSSMKQRLSVGSPYWTNAYYCTLEAVDREMKERARADDAEATIARLANVVRAARDEHINPTSHDVDEGPTFAIHRDSCRRCAFSQATVDAISSLTAEDRRRAGIEG